MFMKRMMDCGAGGHVPPFFRTCLVWVVILMLTTIPFHVSASIAISPARLEVNVGPQGATRQLTVVNRGIDEVKIDFYAGYGSQSIMGAPQYFDDEQARLSASAWIEFIPEKLVLPAGEYAHVTVRFQPLSQTVATYPVLFAQQSAVDAPSSRNGIESRMRIAVPVLATFSAMQAHQRVDPVIRSMAAHTTFGDERLFVDVDVVNEGTVHGPIEVQITAFDSDGVPIKTVDLHSSRVLPGATRRLTSAWDLTEIPRYLRLVGTTQSINGSPQRPEVSPVFMALSLPEEVGKAQENLIVTSLSATSEGDGTALVVESRWSLGSDYGGEVTPDLILYDDMGRALLRMSLAGSVESDGRGNYWFREYVAVAPQRVSDIYGVGLELWVDGVRSGYAATALDADRPDEATVSRIHP